MREYKRGADYVELRPDRAGTHDIGGPMAIIQFLSSGKDRIALPAAIVCDHLVMANAGAIPDLKVADKSNYETYDFLARAAKRYGFDFWPAGAGICHQVFLENYNFPGGMMLVTDSHTPTAGGLGMLAIGVGGADLVDGLMGMEWELKMPKLIGVKLTGHLQGWASPKDVILKHGHPNDEGRYQRHHRILRRRHGIPLRNRQGHDLQHGCGNGSHHVDLPV